MALLDDTIHLCILYIIDSTVIVVNVVLIGIIAMRWVFLKTIRRGFIINIYLRQKIYPWSLSCYKTIVYLHIIIVYTSQSKRGAKQIAELQLQNDRMLFFCWIVQ